ncbi:MAG: hypothetical protein RLN79_04985 [Cytophagales bacterium]
MIEKDLKYYLFKFKNWFYAHMAWILFIIGILILYFSSTYTFSQVEEQNNYWKDLSEKIGISVFSSGVFTAVLKSIQFTGIFKKEIESVMLGTDFIKNRNDLPVLWKSVSNAVYKSKFPELSEDLNNLILKNYLPIEDNYYYKDFRVTIAITELTEDDIIKFTQTCIFKVIALSKETEVLVKNSIQNDKINGQDTLNEKLSYIKIDGKGVDISEIKKDETSTDENNVIDYTIKLKGKLEYLIEKKDVREYSILNDNTKLFRLRHLTKEMDVSISYPDNVNLTFFNIGLANNFEHKHVEHPNYVGRVHKTGVILPHQGFGLAIRKV